MIWRKQKVARPVLSDTTKTTPWGVPASGGCGPAVPPRARPFVVTQTGPWSDPGGAGTEVLQLVALPPFGGRRPIGVDRWPCPGVGIPGHLGAACDVRLRPMGSSLPLCLEVRCMCIHAGSVGTLLREVLGRSFERLALLLAGQQTHNYPWQLLRKCVKPIC